MDATMKQWIDDASYQSLLQRWRFASSGDPIFQGEIGKYYAKVMTEKRSANPGAAVAASKAIGWERRDSGSPGSRKIDGSETGVSLRD